MWRFFDKRRAIEERRELERVSKVAVGSEIGVRV
jgi:hypothetical protein